MTARWIAAMFALAMPLAAQNLLMVDNGGRFELVRRAEERQAFVLEGGKWTACTSRAFAFQSTAEYVPVLIDVHHPYFHRGARAISDNGTSRVRLVNAGRFVFTADLEAQRTVDDVILVLELKNWKYGTASFVWGVGRLEAHRPRRISIDHTTPFKLTGVRLLAVHLFVDGREAFTSDLPESDRAAALDRMVAARIAAVRNAEVQPLYVADPVYPDALKARVTGRAVLDFRVDARGRVEDPTVASATDPAFGVSAIEAIRQWRFVPKIKDGAAVESTAELPFVFAPPT